jgi:hypothetical protein
VSVAIEGASLADILDEISAQTGITLVLHGSPRGQISARFESVALEEALRRLITDSFVLRYSSGAERPEVDIWIVSSGGPGAPGAPPSPAVGALVPRPIPGRTSPSTFCSSSCPEETRGNDKRRCGGWAISRTRARWRRSREHWRETRIRT